MPQIKRAATRLVPHQTMMNLKRATGGSQNTSRTSTAQKRGGDKREVGKDNRIGRKDAIAQRLFALSRKDQNRLRLDRRRCLEIAHAVADTRNAGQIDAESIADFDEHPRFGLAALARRIGGVRAIEHGVDATAQMRKRLVHLVIDRNQCRHVEQAAPQP